MNCCMANQMAMMPVLDKYSGSLEQIRIKKPTKSKPFPVEKTPASIAPTHSKAKSTGNKDAPVTKKAEQNQIYKAWNLVPDGKLESFPEIKKQVNQAANRALRSLHHTLYGELQYTSLQSRTLESKALRKEILKFKGLPFKKNSEEYKKHLTILKRMSDSSINKIVKMLNIKKKSIPEIMDFIMKPVEIIFCAGDPYQPSMQPIVNVQRMQLGAAASIPKVPEIGQIIEIATTVHDVEDTLNIHVDPSPPPTEAANTVSCSVSNPPSQTNVSEDSDSEEIREFDRDLELYAESDSPSPPGATDPLPDGITVQDLFSDVLIRVSLSEDEDESLPPAPAIDHNWDAPPVIEKFVLGPEDIWDINNPKYVSTGYNYMRERGGLFQQKG